MLLCRGYTRKEPFSNGIWTPKAENWNGRVAMMGFTGIIITEALAGKSVLQVNQMWLARPHTTTVPMRVLIYLLCLACVLIDVTVDICYLFVQFYGLAKGVDPAGLP